MKEMHTRKGFSMTVNENPCTGAWVWILKVYGLDVKQTDSAVTLPLFLQSIIIFWIQFPIV